MGTRSTSFHPHIRLIRLLGLLLVAFAILLAGGCGRKGDPHPKSDLHDRVDSGK